MGRNFVVTTLELLEEENLGLDVDIKTIEMLNYLTGCDSKSDSVDSDLIELIGQKNGLKIISKSISDNNYDFDYQQLCMPLVA